jgi:hypothetical protein
LIRDKFQRLPSREPSKCPNRGKRGLFHFASGRTHSGGLLRLRVKADQGHSAHSFSADAKHVTTSPQLGLHFFGQSVGHRQAAQVGAVLAEGSYEMGGGEARRLERLRLWKMSVMGIYRQLAICARLHLSLNSRHVRRQFNQGKRRHSN